VKDKKAIIVLGEEGCGKTLVVDALNGIKVGKYVHLGNKKSRINHNAKADPFVNLVPINEN
jgi:energy-coupling factor transporter ATP-binding protein EcfA2